MNKKIKIIMITIFILIVSTISIASYKLTVFGKAEAKLKKPIFLLNHNEIIDAQISSRSNNSYETTFNILNFIEDNSISEIDFEYIIKLLPSSTNFPIKYRLLDLNENKELFLDSNLETDKITIGTNKEIHNYKLIVEWDMENNNQNLEENLNVEILVKGVQKK